MKNKANWYRQRKAILYPYEKAISEQCPKTPTGSGIYILTRKEDGENKAYIGQSIHILQRIAEHMVDYDSHIDRSLKIYGLKTILNPKGWKLESYVCDISKLDSEETSRVAEYIAKGYDVYNKTSGGQGAGKRKVAEYQERKGYRQGVDNGYNKTRKEFAELLAKVEYAFAEKINKNGTQNANSVKALQKIKEFIKVE